MISWQMPIDIYRDYVSEPKPVWTLRLKTSAGSSILTDDMRLYIQPSFFANITSTLTEGRSAEDFVREVDNVKNQIVTYGKGLGEAPYQFPAETLTEGRGFCADTTILMASMLTAGDNQANYGFKVYIWYVELNSNGTLVSNNNAITEANHAIVEVEVELQVSATFEMTTRYEAVHHAQSAMWSPVLRTLFKLTSR